MTFAFREITVLILGMLLHLSVVSAHAATHRALVFGLGRQADPTYINAPLGHTMPQMDNKTAKVILLEKKTYLQ